MLKVLRYRWLDLRGWKQFFVWWHTRRRLNDIKHGRL